MFHTYTILIVGACLPIVSASIYPTEPTQATVWAANRPETVSWIEDWKYPTLNEMGVFDVSLWTSETYLAQLASGVDPMAKTRSVGVMVPAGVLSVSAGGDLTCTLRFTTRKPVDTVIYSADFVIVSGNATVGSVTGTANSSTSAAGGITLATPNGTESGFRTVVTTQGTGSFSPNWTTSATVPLSSSASGSTTPLGTPPPLGSIPVQGGAQGEGQRVSSATMTRRGVDMEKVKFRFVFVFWPVLMGISMAL